MTSSADLSGESVDDLLKYAKTAESAERYEDMSQYMKALSEKKLATSEILATEERNLLSVAYKNVVGQKRASWRTMKSGQWQDDGQMEQSKVYLTLIEKELTVVCDEVLGMIDKLQAALQEKKKYRRRWFQETRRYRVLS